jgi:hypothetical protein
LFEKVNTNMFDVSTLKPVRAGESTKTKNKPEDVGHIGSTDTAQSKYPVLHLH